MNKNRANKNLTKVTVVLFILILALFFYIGVLAPKDSSSVSNENRDLAPMPDLNREAVFSGSFSKDFEDYLADNVGYRSFFINISSKLEGLKGFKPAGGKIVSTNKSLGVDDAGENHLLILSDRVMEVYKRDDNAREQYVDMLNTYAKALPESVKMYSMLVPTQIEFSEKSNLADSQKETIDYIYENADDRITTVNVYDALKEHKDEYIYFRGDHHWTQLGAFYAYNEFSKINGSGEKNLSDYTKNFREGFLGYLYNQANDPSLKKHADTIEWFVNGENYEFTAKAMEDGGLKEYKSHIYNIPPNSESPKYSIFMGGDYQFLEINTNNKNKKTLLVVKDSYANALIPLLTRDFETIIVIDPRSYFGTVSALTEEYNITDCLFINYCFTTTFPDFINKMIEIK